MTGFRPEGFRKVNPGENFLLKITLKIKRLINPRGRFFISASSAETLPHGLWFKTNMAEGLCSGASQTGVRKVARVPWLGWSKSKWGHKDSPGARAGGSPEWRPPARTERFARRTHSAGVSSTTNFQFAGRHRSIDSTRNGNTCSRPTPNGACPKNTKDVVGSFAWAQRSFTVQALPSFEGIRARPSSTWLEGTTQDLASWVHGQIRSNPTRGSAEPQRQ